MSERYLKRIVIGAWVILFFVLAIFVWVHSVPLSRSFSNPLFAIKYFQRLFALFAFVLMADQIVTGAFLSKITEKLGGWFFHYHVLQGAFTYALIFIHPILQLAFLSIARTSFDPFYIFTDFCVVCVTRPELFLTLGRFAFWLSIIAFLAAIFRTKIYQLRPYWRYLHIINYVVFVLIAVHAWFYGTDVVKTFYQWIYFAAVLMVTLTILYKFSITFKKNFKLK